MQIRTDRGWIRAGLAVLVTGILGGGVLAAACGTNSPQKLTADGKAAAAAAEPGPASPPAEEDRTRAGPVVGDKVVMGDGSVTVSAVEDNVSAGRLFGAGKGFKYIAADVKGCSGPNEKNITFEPAYFLLRLDDGTIRDPGVDAKKPSLAGGTVPPGKCLSGWVTFTVPEGALATGLIYDGSVRTTWTVPLPKNAKPTTTTTLKPGATTSTTRETDGHATTPTSSKPKTTATTAKTTSTTGKPTATTARSSSTATTSKSSSKSTTTTGKSGSTPTTGKSSGSTTTTSKSGSASTTSTSPSGKSSGSTTTTTGKSTPLPTRPATTSTTTDDG
jgi:Domain of unknown function (DUF4352)